VLLIVDEVICGFGRTGSWFGHDRYGVRPDIVTMAKGITSAYIPLAATVVSDEVFSAFPADGGVERLRHINTFGGHPAGCAVAVKNIDILEDEGMIERSATVGAELLARLQDALGGHPAVGEVRGRGLLIGIEVVADHATREPSGPTAAAIVKAAQGRGLLLGRNADTAAGLDNVVAIAPPLCVTEEDVHHIVNVMTESFAEVQ
jgi:taurine-pyruvate aminotransferase